MRGREGEHGGQGGEGREGEEASNRGTVETERAGMEMRGREGRDAECERHMPLSQWAWGRRRVRNEMVRGLCEHC